MGDLIGFLLINSVSKRVVQQIISTNTMAIVNILLNISKDITKSSPCIDIIVFLHLEIIFDL